MGVVYEGYDPLIERAVAIKALRIDEANAQLDAELRMRFRREAQAAGRLSHPASSRSTSTARRPARAAPSSPWSWSKAAT